MCSDNIKEEIKFVARRVYYPFYRAASRLWYWKPKCVRPGGTGGKLLALFYDLTRDSIANNFVVDVYCRLTIYSNSVTLLLSAFWQIHHCFNGKCIPQLYSLFQMWFGYWLRFPRKVSANLGFCIGIRPKLKQYSKSYTNLKTNFSKWCLKYERK